MGLQSAAFYQASRELARTIASGMRRGDDLRPMSVSLEHRIRVRYAETDQMGVVYHANHLIYMEEARTLLLEKVGYPYHELEASGLAMVVRKAELRYHAPIRYGDEVVVRIEVPKIGGATILFAYEIVHGSTGERLSRGTTELGCMRVDGKQRRATAVPAEIRAALQDGS
jgi:acyl-CoA thioester hydrolase